MLQWLDVCSVKSKDERGPFITIMCFSTNNDAKIISYFDICKSPDDFFKKFLHPVHPVSRPPNAVFP